MANRVNKLRRGRRQSRRVSLPNDLTLPLPIHTVSWKRNSTHDKIWKRWNEVKMGENNHTKMGMTEWNTSVHHIPRDEDIHQACGVNGKVDTRLIEAMQEGTFAKITGQMAAEDISRQWSEKTIDDKMRAVKAMFAFLKATGRMTRFFPDDEIVTTYPTEEEKVLSEFAVMRILAGNGTATAAAMVSHVRTYARVMLNREFGKAGTMQHKSTTSQVIKGMSRYFNKEKQVDEKRRPLTWQLVKMMYDEGRRTSKTNEGVAIAIAYAGLYRMGELTSSASGNRPFNQTTDLAETHLLFTPTFWTAQTVTIYIGGSKADQDGTKDAVRPRVLPTTGNTPGRWLRDLLAQRHNLPIGEDPVLKNEPLFLNGKGGHLSQTQVLAHMRRTLDKAGFTKSQQLKYGTHSARIGGATALFKNGATMDVIKELGGWSSDAYKVYVRVQRDDMLKYSHLMCSENEM